MFGGSGFLEVLDVGESAFEGAFGLDAVTVKELEFAQAGGAGRIFLIAFVVDFEFAFVIGALAAPEEPAGEDGIGDESGP